jgi:hypothetical protein
LNRFYIKNVKDSFFIIFIGKENDKAKKPPNRTALIL